MGDYKGFCPILLCFILYGNMEKLKYVSPKKFHEEAVNFKPALHHPPFPPRQKNKRGSGQWILRRFPGLPARRLRQKKAGKLFRPLQVNYRIYGKNPQ